jgi:RNA polymerase sigma-70 factor (ECF subfamily)
VSEPTRIEEGVNVLVRGAQAGDPAAFEGLVRRYYGQIHRWALGRTGDRDDADDVTQEVLVRLHRYLGRFDGRSRFTTWLYQVTRTAASDLQRRRQRRARLTLKLERQSASAAYDAREESGSPDDRRAAELVRAFVLELSERQREIFDLVDLQGHEPAEVSEMLGMEQVTVRSHLFRARQAIRRKILESAPELVEGYGD